MSEEYFFLERHGGVRGYSFCDCGEHVGESGRRGRLAYPVRLRTRLRVFGEDYRARAVLSPIVLLLQEK